MKYHVMVDDERKVWFVGAGKSGRNLVFKEDDGILFQHCGSARKETLRLQGQGFNRLCCIDVPATPSAEELSDLFNWAATFWRTALRGNLDPEGIQDPQVKAAVDTMLAAANRLPPVRLITGRPKPSKYDFWEAA